MNRQQITGAIKEAFGETQEQFGKLVGSEAQRAKGHAREQQGKTEKATGILKEALRDSAKSHH